MSKIVSILIIEDDSMTADLYQRLLESAGYNVLLAPDTYTAEQILKSIEADLLILDYHLPDAIGWEWLQRLRIQSPYAELPVILVSSVRQDPRQHESLRHDRYVWFMEKPRQPQQIVVAVEHTITQFG